MKDLPPCLIQFGRGEEWQWCVLARDWRMLPLADPSWNPESGANQGQNGANSHVYKYGAPQDSLPRTSSFRISRILQN